MKGEEITVLYLPPKMKKAQRQMLLSHWLLGTCRCEKCESEVGGVQDLYGCSDA